MKFLFKIEDLLNTGLCWLGEKIVQVWIKICPAWLARWQGKISHRLTQIKALPTTVKARALALKDSPRELLKVDYKGVFTQAMEAAKKVYAQHKQHSPLKAIVSALAAPFGFLYQWAKSLKPAHFVLLFVFTLGSVLSLMGIAINSHRILKQSDAARAPASVEQVDPYDRPEYYKKETREVTFTNVKLPVFVTGITELRSLLVDFSTITSNRATKQWLERHEFQIRDHLVLTVEPVLPAFPMTDEGRTILVDKLKHELNIFLAQNQIEGTVTEVRIVYILAN